MIKGGMTGCIPGGIDWSLRSRAVNSTSRRCLRLQVRLNIKRPTHESFDVWRRSRDVQAPESLFFFFARGVWECATVGGKAYIGSTEGVTYGVYNIMR